MKLTKILIPTSLIMTPLIAISGCSKNDYVDVLKPYKPKIDPLDPKPEQITKTQATNEYVTAIMKNSDILKDDLLFTYATRLSNHFTNFSEYKIKFFDFVINSNGSFTYKTAAIIKGSIPSKYTNIDINVETYCESLYNLHYSKQEKIDNVLYNDFYWGELWNTRMHIKLQGSFNVIGSEKVYEYRDVNVDEWIPVHSTVPLEKEHYLKVTLDTINLPLLTYSHENDEEYRVVSNYFKNINVKQN